MKGASTARPFEIGWCRPSGDQHAAVGPREPRVAALPMRKQTELTVICCAVELPASTRSFGCLPSPFGVVGLRSSSLPPPWPQGPVWPVRASSKPPPAPQRLDAEIVWQVELPSSQTIWFRSFHLIEGRIYAMATDGSVVAVRADTGEVSWMGSLVHEGDALSPPVAYLTQERKAVAFTELNRVVLLDPKTGVEIDVLNMAKPAICQASVAPGAGIRRPGQRQTGGLPASGWLCLLAGGVRRSVHLSPGLRPGDQCGGCRRQRRSGGRLAERALHGFRREACDLQAELAVSASGELAMDGDMLYLSTANQTLHAIDMGRDADSMPAMSCGSIGCPRFPRGGPF